MIAGTTIAGTMIAGGATNSHSLRIK